MSDQSDHAREVAEKLAKASEAANVVMDRLRAERDARAVAAEAPARPRPDVQFRAELAEHQSKAEEKSPAQIAASKLHDQLKDRFWTDGGFLQSIGVGSEMGEPVIFVFLARPLYHFEEKLIPGVIDDFSVITKVIGEIRIGGQ